MSYLIKRIFIVMILFIFIIVFLFLSTFGMWPSRYTREALSSSEEESARHLSDIVNFLAGELGERSYRNPSQYDEAKQFIVRAFSQLGYTVDLQAYDYQGKTYHNIIAEKPDKSDQPVWIIGAHYDTFHNPGADDNASGIAGLLEMARLLRESQIAIRFIAFANEEPPFYGQKMMGSQVYARYLRQNDISIKGMISLEMIGFYSQALYSQRYMPPLGVFFPNRGNFIAFVSNLQSGKLTKSFSKKFQETKRFPSRTLIAPEIIRPIRFSDHASFWDEGYPAFMITDTAYLRNPHYHKATDLPDTLDYHLMAKLIHTLAYVFEHQIEK